MGLTFIAIVLLASAWAAILLPDLRNRGGAPRRNNSVKSFNQQLSGLGRTRPSGSRPLGSSSRATLARPASAVNSPRPRTSVTGQSPMEAAHPGAPAAAGVARPLVQ